MLSSLLLWVSLAWAAPPDFAGTWRLDLKASGSLDELLEAKGVGWAQRQAAKMIVVTQIWSFQDEATLQIVVDSAVMGSTETLKLDGTPQPKTSKEGDALVNRSRWEGEELVTVSDIRSHDGRQSRLELRRRLEQGGAVLVQRTIYTDSEGQTWAVDRVFNRQ